MTIARGLAAACAIAAAAACHATIGDGFGGADAESADAGPAVEPDAAGVCAAPFDLSAALLPIREAAGLPALTATAASSSCPIATGTVGVRKVGDPAPVTAGDAWHLGSCTMAMTAAVVAQLVEQGVLDWDTTLPYLLPDTEMLDVYRSVRLVDLLAHTSGLRRDHPVLVELAEARAGSTREQRAWLASQVLQTLPLAEPGTAYEHSHSGYVIVGAILERATGSSWEQLMAQRIFAPLGMTSCGFGHPHSTGQVDGLWGHDGNGAVAASPLSPIYGPASHVHCTLADWTKFVTLFLDDADNAILSRDSMIALTTGRTSVETSILYALGWVVDIEGPLLQHSGTDGTFVSLVWVARGHDRVYLAATNRGGDATAVVGRVVEAMAERFVE